MWKILLTAAAIIIDLAPTAALALSQSQIPTKIPITWGASAPGGNITCPMPQASQISITPGRASWTDGFPPLTFLPGSGGGVPPFGADFNGVLCQLSQWARWYTAAGLFVPYDPTFQAAIGGYPANAIVASASIFGRYYISTVDNNLSNPDTGGANWVLLGPTMIGTLGGVLTGTLPNPGMAAGAAAANVGGLGGILTGTLPSPGMAAGAAAANVGSLGGALSGVLPNPSIGPTGVSAGTYTNTTVNVGADGRIYGIANGSASSQPTYFTAGSGSSATFNTPAGCIRLKIRMMAAGGGGSSGSGNGAAGGDSSFGSTTVAHGGGGAAGVGGAGGTGGSTGTGAQIIRFAGGNGGGNWNVTIPAGTQDTFAIAGGAGGTGPFGGAGQGTFNGGGTSAVQYTGAGGGGDVHAATSAGTYTGWGGGGAGEYVEFVIYNPVSSYSYTVGVGGAGTGAAASRRQRHHPRRGVLHAMRKLILALLLCCLGASPVLAQSNPGLVYGQVPTAAQWNSYFASKTDYTGSPALPISGGTMLGPLITAPSSATGAGFNLAPGSAPTVPNNGDVWTTSSGMFVRINGVTIGPLTQGSGGSFGATAPLAVAFPGGVVTYAITGQAGGVLAGSGATFTPTPTLGVAGSTVGSLTFANATSGGVTLASVAGALGTVTASLPANTGTIAETNLAQTWTAEQDYTLNHNAATTQTITNTSAGTSALAYWGVSNGASVGGFGIAGTNYSVALLAGRTYALGTNGIVLGTNGAFPVIFAVNNAEVGRWSSVNPGVLQIGLSGTTTGAAAFENDTSGAIDLQAPNGVGLSGTLTLPNVTDTLTGKATTDALTNKTLASSTDTLGGVTAGFGSDATGDIYYRNSGGQLARLGVGFERIRAHRQRRPPGVGNRGHGFEHRRRHDRHQRGLDPAGPLRRRRRRRRGRGVQQRHDPDRRLRRAGVQHDGRPAGRHRRHRDRMVVLHADDRVRQRRRGRLQLPDRPLQDAGKDGLVRGSDPGFRGRHLYGWGHFHHHRRTAGDGGQRRRQLYCRWLQLSKQQSDDRNAGGQHHVFPGFTVRWHLSGFYRHIGLHRNL